MQQKHSTEQDRSWWQKLHGNLLYLYFRVSFISVMSPEKNKMKIDHRFSFFIFLKKLKFDTDFLFSFFYVQKKIKIEHRFSFVIFHFSISKNVKIDHRFSFFIFLCLEKNENWNQLSIFIFPWTQIFIFHFSTFRKNEWP